MQSTFLFIIEFKENVAEYKGIKLHRLEMEYDIDVGRYVELMFAFMPEGENPTPPQLVAMMQGANPIISTDFGGIFYCESWL